MSARAAARAEIASLEATLLAFGVPRRRVRRMGVEAMRNLRARLLVEAMEAPPGGRKRRRLGRS